MGEWSNRGYLPHYEDRLLIQAITYRLSDALPQEAALRMAELARNDAQRRAIMEEHLDGGCGSCLLRDDRVAKIVADGWRYFDRRRYLLHAWVVMPNHVHVLIEPFGTHTVREIVHSWKSFTAKAILGCSHGSAGVSPVPIVDAGGTPALLDAGGTPALQGLGRRIWQPDYFDRYIRNDAHYHAAIDYIHQNPVKAGLVRLPQHWRWSSAHGDP